MSHDEGAERDGASVEELRAEVERLRAEKAALEAAQVALWGEYVGNTRAEILAHRDMINDLKHTLSWRVTRPIRDLRSIGRRAS